MRHATLGASALIFLLAAARDAACGGPKAGSPPPAGTASGARSGEGHSAGKGTTVSCVGGQARDGEVLLALGGDRLLLWSAQGRARLRSATGEWSELALPLAPVRQALAKGAELLLLGQVPATHETAVSRVSAEGQELTRWVLPKDALFGASIDAARMQVTLPSGVVGLQPDGSLTPPRALPEDGHHTGFGGLHWVELADATIVCHGADLSMASNTPGHCRRQGAGGWEFEGPFVEPPTECGSWLITSTSTDGKKLQVRDEQTGQPQGAAKLSTLPLLACAGPNEVLLGTRELAIRRLPSFEVAWRYPVGKSPPQQMALMDSFIAYVASGSSNIMLVPKPALLTH